METWRQERMSTVPLGLPLDRPQQSPIPSSALDGAPRLSECPTCYQSDFQDESQWSTEVRLRYA
jgi:hypothetical protein